MFTVLVHFTDRSRTSTGGFTTFTAIVDVLADDDTTAQLIGAQIVAALRCDLDVMVTATTTI